MKLIKRFILFLSIFLLVVPIHQSARAYQYGKNPGDINHAAGYYVGLGTPTPHHIIQHRRAYITSVSATPSRKSDGTHDATDENREENDQVENEENETAGLKKQAKQAYCFVIPFCMQAPGYFDNAVKNCTSSGLHSYASYRYILYNVIRI